MSKKWTSRQNRGRCDQERTRVMGEESEAGVVDIESQHEQGRGCEVRCEERSMWRGKVNKAWRGRSGEQGNECQECR